MSNKRISIHNNTHTPGTQSNILGTFSFPKFVRDFCVTHQTITNSILPTPVYAQNKPVSISISLSLLHSLSPSLSLYISLHLSLSVYNCLSAKHTNSRSLQYNEITQDFNKKKTQRLKLTKESFYYISRNSITLTFTIHIFNRC